MPDFYKLVARIYLLVVKANIYKKEVDTFITKSKHFERMCCKHTFLINEKKQIWNYLVGFNLMILKHNFWEYSLLSSLTFNENSWVIKLDH